MRSMIYSTAIALLTAPAIHAQTAEVVGQYDWKTRSAVGLSGLEVSKDGSTFVAVSDQGWLFNGEFAREDGQISQVTLETLLPLRGIDGLPVAARRINDWSDSEGLAIDESGQHWVSFERWARVSTFDENGLERATQSHTDFEGFRENRQLEALAIAPDGTLITFSEKAKAGAFAVYRYDGVAWRIEGSVPASKRYSIVGADFDGAGRMYLLERKLGLGWWWQNRIRRFDDASLTEGVVIWESARGDYGNLEGIAVWRDATGTRLTLVSDNNAGNAEITQFVELAVRE